MTYEKKYQTLDNELESGSELEEKNDQLSGQELKLHQISSEKNSHESEIEQKGSGSDSDNLLPSDQDNSLNENNYNNYNHQIGSNANKSIPSNYDQYKVWLDSRFYQYEYLKWFKKSREIYKQNWKVLTCLLFAVFFFLFAILFVTILLTSLSLQGKIFEDVEPKNTESFQGAPSNKLFGTPTRFVKKQNRNLFKNKNKNDNDDGNSYESRLGVQEKNLKTKPIPDDENKKIQDYKWSKQTILVLFFGLLALWFLSLIFIPGSIHIIHKAILNYYDIDKQNQKEIKFLDLFYLFKGGKKLFFGMSLLLLIDITLVFLNSFEIWGLSIISDYLLLILFFSPFFLVINCKRCKIFDSIKYSKKLIHRKVFGLIWLQFLNGLIFFAGALFFGFGLIVAIPIFGIFNTIAYIEIFGSEGIPLTQELKIVDYAKEN
ncbi:adenylate cyclase type [Anaeramoeba flamelloides]|uniref:Adenylate cyclase type n=1 Tax=Anaeramoeba flamelloides TaxID=1746091 RepID=A0AAV7YGR5_9EUKA|nr:adenylate cyclase type [Anaeramoeba flamelloides]